MAYEHLRIEREAPLTERHPRRPAPPFRPENPREFGLRVGGLLRDMRVRIAQPDVADIGGFDARKLLKLTLRAGEMLPDLEAIAGVEIVSHERKEIVLAFASDAALDEVEARLATLATRGDVTRKELLYALESFDHWSPEDRIGHALREHGFPTRSPFELDVELWPQERQDRRDTMLEAFRQWLGAQRIELLDTIRQPSLLMARVRCEQARAEQLLRHRDIRTVDLPPRLGISIELLNTDINQFPPIEPPDEEAPAVAVLDSGLTSGHPLLSRAVADAQGFLPPERSPDDEPPHWHGTFVGALALYGDVYGCIQRGQFVPQLRLLSGKVFKDDGEDQTGFVETAVEAAVRELHGQYGCRVFNLSYGDLNKVYDDRHVRGLAYTLDRLTRELGVLFIVPTGNLIPAELPDDAREAFPRYLLASNARLLDPATALNAVTVGGLTLNEATRDAQRYPNAIEDHPLARAEQPFPLTRSGPSVNDAIKPDIVEGAGNLAVMRVGGRTRHAGLGVVSLNGGFLGGLAFREDIGTSYSAPMVAHRAARLLATVPGASASLLRALLGAHARWPKACETLLNPDGDEAGRERLLRLVGYGRIDERAMFRSLDDTVTLLTEERISNDRHHFFELPLPDSFWTGGRRLREITVALAHSPAVRTTRLEYRASKLWFSLVTAASLDEVTQAFSRNREQGMGERPTGRWLSNEARKNGTLQVSRWSFRQALGNGHKVFIVATRQDSSWSTLRDTEEPYALAVVLADREETNSQLYAHVRAALQARAQARARARLQR